MSLVFSQNIVDTASDFEHAVAQIPDSNLHDASGIVLRVHARLWRELVEQSYDSKAMDNHIQAVCKRAPNLDIYVLADGHSAAESRTVFVAQQGPRQLIEGTTQSLVFRQISPILLAEIRHIDLTEVFEMARSRCVVCTSANHHFSLPSGAHASQFLRLGDAFTDIQTVDRVAYWIAVEIQTRAPLMMLEKRYALLVDHPSMLILAARVQLLVADAVEIVAFPNYPSDVESRTASFDLLKQVASRCSAVFVAIGVASTGRLANFIQRWAIQASSIEFSVFVLYSVRTLPEIQVLCELSLRDYRHYPSLEECLLCQEHSSPVQIQSSSYLVGYAPSEPVALIPSFFEQQRDFLERWGKYDGVLRVHYDDPNESSARHHAFYVDIATLLNIASFTEEVISAAQRFQPVPDVIVVPDHPTALKIGELIAVALNRPLVILDATLVAEGRGAVDSNLESAACALVIDDVFITGSRLQSVNGFLRENRVGRAPCIQHIHYWTLLATPASRKRYDGVVRGMTRNHDWTSELTHLYHLTLPDWHDALHCPWCQEYNVLTGLAQAAGDFDGPIVDRLSVLASKSTGVISSPFYVEDRVKLPNLGAQSVVLPQGANHMQVLFACASAIQQLRQSTTKSLNADQFPAPAFFADRNFSSNYTERLIWLGMLRSLKSSELDPALRSLLAGSALDENDAQGALVRGELAIAWLTGKLGAIQVSQVSKQFFAYSGISWAALFDKALVDREPP